MSSVERSRGRLTAAVRDSSAPTIAVVIPAFRAAAHIKGVLAGIPDFVSTIVVVNDSSPDETADLVAHWHDARVQLISHQANQGVGGAVLTGYNAAIERGAEIIVKMDSDGQMDPRYLWSLVLPIVRGDADYTKGNRFLHARQLRSMPVLRRIGNIGLSFFTKLASGYWQVFDPTNGYTAIHATLVPLLKDGQIHRRYFFESSMLLELGLIRAVVHDVAIPARYGDEQSSLSERHTFIEFPPRLLAGLGRRIILQYFVRDFGLFAVFLVSGALLTLFGVLFGTFHWLRSANLSIGTPTGTVMLAVLPIVLGIQFLLQAVTLDVQSSPTRALHHYLIASRCAPATTVPTTSTSEPNRTERA
jgi:glycosyltransferase involved in cell wall biosynthesis